MKISKTTKRLTEYLIFPLAFFLSGFLFLYALLSPFVNMALSAWSLFSSDGNSVNSEEIHKDIFGTESIEAVDNTVKASQITFPRSGTKYAELSAYSEDSSYPAVSVFFGDTKSILRKGIGHYPGSSFPGEGSTVLLGGHNNTHCLFLQYLKVGDLINIKTNYGQYLYRINEIAIKKHNSPSAYDLSATKENLVIYTCYPFDELGLTTKRYFVYAEYVSGPKILSYK